MATPEQKSFSHTFEGTADELLSRARKQAQAFGASIIGDQECGAFTAYGVEGTYRIEKRTVTVKILKKPFVAPWNMVEDSVSKIFR